MSTTTIDSYSQDEDAAAQLMDEMTAEEPVRFNGWLIFMGLLLLVAPLYLIANTLQTDTADKEAELAQLQQSLNQEPATNQEEEQLNDRLLAIRQDIMMLEGRNLTSSTFNWPAISATLANYDAEQLSLTSTTQEQFQLTLNGSATSEMAVMEYARYLDASGRFERVSIQAITTATSTGSEVKPGQAAPTPPAQRSPADQTAQSTDLRTTRFAILVVLKAGV